MFIGAVTLVTSIYYLKINPEDFVASHSRFAEYVAEVASETYNLFDGQHKQCYTGPNGHKPFSEHDGYYEDISRLSVVYEVDMWYPKPVSKFQDIEMFHSAFFGNVLVIDSEIMITDRDESHYHEMIAHVPLAYVPNAKRVLIIGGGDGGTLGQVLKHMNIKEVTIIELDPAVVQTSKKYFPQLAKAYDDARVTLLHENGAKWIADYVGAEYSDDIELDAAVESILGDGDERIRATRRPKVVRAGSSENEGNRKKIKQKKNGKRSDIIDFSGIGGGKVNPGGDNSDVDSDSNSDSNSNSDSTEANGKRRLPGGDYYDVVLVDSTDFGVAKPLFTRSFYENVKKMLKPKTGILCFNVESPSWAERTVNVVQQFLSSIYRHAYIYHLAMPTYSSGHYSFLMASDTIHPLQTKINWKAFYKKNLLKNMHYYTPALHYGSFALPNHVRSGKRITVEMYAEALSDLMEDEDEDEDEEEDDEEEEEDEEEDDENEVKKKRKKNKTKKKKNKTKTTAELLADNMKKRRRQKDVNFGVLDQPEGIQFGPVKGSLDDLNSGDSTFSFSTNPNRDVYDQL